MLHSLAQASFFADKNSHAYTIELIGISETSSPTEPLFKMMHFNGLAGTDVPGNTSMNHYANADHTVFKDAAVTTIEGFLLAESVTIILQIYMKKVSEIVLSFHITAPTI